MRWISCLFLALLLPAPALGQSALALYAIDGNFAPDSEQTSMLYRIDPDDGSVLEVVGDTGLNLTAIVYWPPTDTFLATTVTHSDAPSFLAEINPLTAETTLLRPIVQEPLYSIKEPYQFTSIEISPNDQPGRLLTLALSEEGNYLRWLAVDEGLLFSNPFSGFAPQGSFALAASDADDFRLQWVFFGCESPPSTDSYYRSLIATSSPPIIPIIIDLPDSSCFIDGLRIAEENYLGIQFERANATERQLTYLSIQNDQATLQPLGRLPDNTVSIARGPSPPSNVPLFRLWGLMISAIFLALIGAGSLRNRIA